MPDLFGLDLAGIVNDAIESAGGLVPLSLIKEVETPPPPDDPGGAGTVTQTTYPGNGIIDDYEDEHIDGTLVKRGDRQILILGASLPSGIIPAEDDKVTIEEGTYNVVAIKRDPAAATYVCQSRGS